MNRLAASALGNAIVWAAVILAVSAILKGSPYLGIVIPIMGAGAAVSVLLVGGMIRRTR